MDMEKIKKLMKGGEEDRAKRMKALREEIDNFIDGEVTEVAKEDVQLRKIAKALVGRTEEEIFMFLKFGVILEVKA